MAPRIRITQLATPDTPAIALAFSNWLRGTREKMGFTRYALGKAGWVKESTLKTLEDSAHDPRLSTFVAACRGLGKNPATVLAALLKEVGE